MEFRQEYGRAFAELKAEYSRKGRAGSEWHALRAKGMGIDPLEKAKHCKSDKWISCGCKAFSVGGCQSPLCRKCNRLRWGAVRRRVLRAVVRHGNRKWRMMTLAGPPRKTPQESAVALQAAWKRMYAWLWNQWFRKVPKDLRKRQKFVFCAAIEVGERNGLIHMHVLAQFPKGIDYGEAGEEWARAYPGAVSGGLHFSRREYVDQVTGECRQTTVFGPKVAASYLAKYVTKGSQLLKLGPQKAARTFRALYGRRRMRASQGFWTAPAPTCEECGWKWGLATTEEAQDFAIAIHEKRKAERLWAKRPSTRPPPMVGNLTALRAGWEKQATLPLGSCTSGAMASGGKAPNARA